MSSAAALNAWRPGYHLDDYPENRRPYPHALSRHSRALAQRFRAARLKRDVARIGRTVFDAARQLDDDAFPDQLLQLRHDLRDGGWTRANLVHALAMTGSRVRQIHGFELHPTQYAAAWIMLRGQLVEMATGEGKTIVAAITAVVAGISGLPVHVITSNDYLVERDAQGMRPLFDAFGLSCGLVRESSTPDERRAAYSCHVCYVSNKQLVFDYLRDRQACGARPSSVTARTGALSGRASSRPLLRGLSFGIVDEADSALIDDAITPLILSHQTEGRDEMAQAVTALSLARRLKIETHFTSNLQTRRVELTRDGEAHLEEMAEGLQGKWRNRRFRNELAQQALAATHVYRRDIDYLVQDGCVQLIDQATGRLMPDRKLQNGLHQIIEAKERCELSGATRTIASLSFQNFFTRYKHLCGMTGTAREAAGELLNTYTLGVVRVPTHRPSQRRDGGTRFAATREDYRAWLIESVRQRRRAGQPVLIGTRSLAHSERLSEWLDEAGISHAVLNARQDAEEARVVADAGRAAAVTIATNMAGRGTDIPVTDPVRACGGLHVIVSELNESRRVDRQLIGRCARQGDPGSFEYIIAPDDPLLGEPACRDDGVSGVLRLSRLLRGAGARSMRTATAAQKRMERRQRQVRAQVASSDRHLRKRLSYTGYKE